CCLYLSLATTVHPWYLALPLLLSLFTAYRFMILWSLTIVLSYTAYSQPIVHEIPWVLALEYLPVFGLLVWELRRSQITSS
ncbi:MAG: mannosyltransferase, partial [Flavobacteriaceae bacterium]|nr:mannosyltransferase [Flavobacteriaceae bacterium]